MSAARGAMTGAPSWAGQGIRYLVIIVLSLAIFALILVAAGKDPLSIYMSPR